MSFFISKMKLLVSFVLIGYSQLILAAPSPQLTGEIRSYHQVGDKIKGEFARLHPDGSVTKTMAFGDTKQGLQYKTYQMDPQGNVKTVDFPSQQQSQLNQPDGQHLLEKGQPQDQTQITGQPPQAAVPPGVNWFMQQAGPAADPLGASSFGAPNPFQQPGFQDPFFSNSFWNTWNF